MGTEPGDTANSKIPKQTAVTDKRGIWLVCHSNGRCAYKRATVVQWPRQYPWRNALGDGCRQNSPASSRPQVEHYRRVVKVASPLSRILMLIGDPRNPAFGSVGYPRLGKEPLQSPSVRRFAHVLEIVGAGRLKQSADAAMEILDAHIQKLWNVGVGAANSSDLARLPDYAHSLCH